MAAPLGGRYKRRVNLTNGVCQPNRGALIFKSNFGKVIQKIVNNFYLRNLAILVIFVSPDILQKVAMHNSVSAAVTSAKVYSLTAFFLYFVFHNSVLYEKLLRRKKYVLYVIVFLTTLFVWRESTSYFYWLLTKPQNETVYKIRELKEFNSVFWVFVYWADVVYIYIAFGVYLSFRYFNERARLLQVENIQKEMELKQLNEQLNPHFLFNALNNIYSHQLRPNGDARELILKLSELMRYILDNSKKNMVLLDDELMFIENYIAFEAERLGNRCSIDYSKETKGTSFYIVPLILFNFIENAFKHGTTSIHKSAIAIRIKADENVLQLFISNTIYHAPPSAAGMGVGMSNTNRRLELLYGGQYSLDITTDADKYNVCLKINNMA